MNAENSTVDTDLVQDRDTLAGLKKLGLKLPSAERRFRNIADSLLVHRYRPKPNHSLLEEFWQASRNLSSEDAFKIIDEHHDWRHSLQLRTRAGDWKPLNCVLRPGAIVPGDDGRDNSSTVDTEFHELDGELLCKMKVSSGPSVEYGVVGENLFSEYRHNQANVFKGQPGLPHTPQSASLDFVKKSDIGPLSILLQLSEEAAAAYTSALLELDGCFEPWVMAHTGTNRTYREKFDPMECDSLPIYLLKKHGKVKTTSGIVPLAAALSPQPSSSEALDELLQHPNNAKIKKAFKLSDPVPDLFDDGDPTPLTDIWPGLQEHLQGSQRNANLVTCERIRVLGENRLCIAHANDVYLVVSVEDDERAALELVTEVLNIELEGSEISVILKRQTPAEIKKRREEVRQCSTDAERLLAAVGEENLRNRLPRSLLNLLVEGDEPLTAIRIAEAAVALYQSDTLWEFRSALDDLGRPRKWAGSPRAVAFVRSLGFADKWAGEQQRKRPPFEEVEGPLSLPALHPYQKVVAANVRQMLRSDSSDIHQRRGMVSMPTGSGKTRVAVQAIVETVRDDGFSGGILWVADRDELCEQAVEAWVQVWRSEGSEAEQLRISRMWSGQPPPMLTTERHVVVATIQTLKSRLSSRPEEYKFLKDFRLLVIDEAHGSIAPTYTSVMQEIGLTYHRREDEPFLLGLTATPYRGHDKEETNRLASRYGRNRLDRGAFAHDNPEMVVRELQKDGVLAQADHEQIQGGTFQLSPEEREEIWRFTRDPERGEHLLAWLPSSVENRIANSTERTHSILNAHKMHIQSDWPTLIFATSVEHAQTLAALLKLEGVNAAAVTEETKPTARRRVVEDFRKGQIKALCNYGVFREGFDAPKTRAIIVARPVYSPNLYFQMIGRGLRGPLNGGTDRCLILNVEDNIEDFGHSLAFADLDWLWS